VNGSHAIVESWADHFPEKPYDAIISIGAFEHFVQRGFSSEEKVAAYQRFFEQIHGMLRVDCHLSLQTIAWSSVPANVSRASIRHSVFIANRIFPESDLPHLHEIAKACQPYFEISLMRNDRTHYAKTCAMWLDRFRARRPEALAASDEKTVRDYDRYLDACVKQFDANVIELLRISMRRVG
jgi:cyclopropane-fatty-acyl-phospholipid synthase